MTEKNCPVCRGRTTRIFSETHRQFFSCSNCGLKFVWPGPSQAKFNRFYRNGYWQKQEFRGKRALGYLSYEEEKESHFDYFQKILAQTERAVGLPAGRVLDVGCGPGYFLKVAQEQGWKVCGLDLSLEAVKKARSFLETKSIYNKTIHQVKFKTDFFALVTVFQTIEHLAKPGQFLKEVKRVLRPGGLVLLSTPDAGGWQRILMRKSWFSYRHPDHFWFFTEKSLRQLLRNSGFVKIKRVKDPARVYKLGYLLEILPFYIRSHLIRGVAKKLANLSSPLAGLKISIPLDSLVLLAQKP